MSRVSAQKMLHRRITQGLRHPRLQLSHDRTMWVITGQMKVGNKWPLIEVRFLRYFPDLKLIPPKVWCREPWVKRDIDWHVYSDARLCWVLPEQWRDVQGWRGKSNQEVAVDASKWLLASTELLLSRHLYGHLKGLVEWPEEWDQWGHAWIGPHEYHQQQSEQYLLRRKYRNAS